MYAAGLALAYVLVWWLVPARYETLVGGLILVVGLALEAESARLAREELYQALLGHERRLIELEQHMDAANSSDRSQ